VIQLAFAAAGHGQVAELAVTLTLPLPPLEVNEALVGEIEYEHARAGVVAQAWAL
jgi:hypothetical protein